MLLFFTAALQAGDSALEFQLGRFLLTLNPCGHKSERRPQFRCVNVTMLGLLAIEDYYVNAIDHLAARKYVDTCPITLVLGACLSVSKAKLTSHLKPPFDLLG